MSGRRTSFAASEDRFLGASLTCGIISTASDNGATMTDLARGTWKESERQSGPSTEARTLRQDKCALLRAICDGTVDVADDGGGDLHAIFIFDVLLDRGPAHTHAVATVGDAFLQGSTEHGHAWGT